MPCNFEGTLLDTWVGQIPEIHLQPVRSDLGKFDCRNNRLAQVCLRQDGFEDIVIAARGRHGSSRVGVFLGTSTSGILQTEHAYSRRDPDTGTLPEDFLYATTQNSYSLAWFVQSYFRLDGPALVVSTACSSSAKVFATASRMMAAGLCDAAIVGGVDSLCLTTLCGFDSLGLLSTDPCRPFDTNRSGISIGEGAGFIFLERPGTGIAAGGVDLLGYGESSDAHHMSSPHPEGLGAKLAMQGAIDRAGLPANAIQYINLHGTATRTNDEIEGKAVSALFGDRVPCSSTKGWTGHTLGACGAIEAIVAALAIEHGFLPGSAFTEVVDPSFAIQYIKDKVDFAPELVMSNAFGFGGTNCSLVLGRRKK